MQESHQLINQDSGNQEWYSPTEIVEAARRTLGVIKLDPFSCEKANKIVRANYYMTKEDNGWTSDWLRTKCWVNHPFSRENNKMIATKVIEEHQKGCEIVMITFAATSEAWFKPLLNYPQCYLHGRTNYYDQNGNKVKGVTKGSVVTYLGKNIQGFYHSFKHLGTIKVAYQP